MDGVRDNSYLIGNKFARGSKPNKTAFRRGHVPWNKNRKGIHLSPSTEFKKGQKSIRWLPVGTKTIRVDKTKIRRRWIKIAEPGKWEEYAKFIWKKHFKKLLKGDVTHHIDGDRLNDSIENILAFPRTDHPIFHNRWWLKKPTEKQLEFYKGRYK